MKKVITYGTFDILHQGHINLLKRAKDLGDYLIVGITSDNYDKYRGKLNVSDSLIKRIENVRSTGLADKIVVEEYEGQKIDDILKYKVDVFTVGSDWVGYFDYLQEYCELIYLDRTRGVSSTELRNNKSGYIRFGVVGTGRIANRFIAETKLVSGLTVDGVLSAKKESADSFAEKYELSFSTTAFDEMLDKIDAVYIASPHQTHFQYAKDALLAKKHVLCEKPMALKVSEVAELLEIAKQNGAILMEGIKTLYCPGFQRMVSLAKSGRIGTIKSVEATFTKLVPKKSREMQDADFGGSMTELFTYPAIAIQKLLGSSYEEVSFTSYKHDGGVDLFTKTEYIYKNAMATAKVGIGVKSEGELIISGTRGYMYVPAPWWKTDYFEMRFEDQNATRKFYYEFIGDGLRYELVEFMKQIAAGKMSDDSCECSLAIAELLERYRNGEGVRVIR